MPGHLGGYRIPRTCVAPLDLSRRLPDAALRGGAVASCMAKWPLSVVYCRILRMERLPENIRGDAALRHRQAIHTYHHRAVWPLHRSFESACRFWTCYDHLLRTEESPTMIYGREKIKWTI